MIAPDSKSYPFLALAQYMNVPYGVVLLVASGIQKAEHGVLITDAERDALRELLLRHKFGFDIHIEIKLRLKEAKLI